jgi:hypothetical protein
MTTPASCIKRGGSKELARSTNNTDRYPVPAAGFVLKMSFPLVSPVTGPKKKKKKNIKKHRVTETLSIDCVLCISKPVVTFAGVL